MDTLAHISASVKSVENIPEYRGLSRVRFEGDVSGYFELPLERLGVKIPLGSKLEIVISSAKDPEYRQRYSVYVWGVAYHVSEKVTRISVGGLIFHFDSRLPVNVGDKVYIGIIIK